MMVGTQCAKIFVSSHYVSTITNREGAVQRVLDITTLILLQVRVPEMINCHTFRSMAVAECTCGSTIIFKVIGTIYLGRVLGTKEVEVSQTTRFPHSKSTHTEEDLKWVKTKPT